MHRWLFVVVAALLSACSTTQVLHNQVASANVGYDVTADSKVSGRYQASGAYALGKRVNDDEVKWQALLNGVEAAQRDGYDLVAWSGPAVGNITRTKGYLGTNTSWVDAQYPLFTYSVQGYKSGGSYPPDARPTDRVIAEVREKIAKAKAN